MSKPLELTVYPPLERPKRGADIMAYRSQFIDEQLVIQAKRFTDAELAAEYWEHRYGNEVASGWASDYAIIKQSRERLETIGRFATLPHYDEAQS